MKFTIQLFRRIGSAALLLVLGTALPSIGQTVEQTVFINFTLNGSTATSPWNNLVNPPTQQPTYTGIKDNQGATTPIAIESLTNWSAYYDNTSQGSGGVTSGIYPANVVKTYFFADPGSTEQLRFSGLNTARHYRFTFFSSRNSGGDRTTTYKVGSQQVSLNASNNTSNTVTLEGLQPNANGELLLELVTPSSSLFGYLNSVILEAYNPVPLQAPTGLTAQAASENSIHLNWTDNNTGETGYEVYRSTSSTSGFTKITTTAANVTTFTDSGLPANTTYYFKIRAEQNTTFSAYSATVNATAAAGGGGPSNAPFTMYLNLTSSQYLAASPWNNLTAPPTQQPTYSGLKNDQGQNTSITVKSIANWSTFYDNTSQGATGTENGPYPANVTKTFFFADAGSTEQLRFEGLSTVLAYRFTFFASRSNGGNRTTTYKIGTQQVSLNAANNTNQTVELAGLTPNSSGVLTLEIITPAAAEFGYLNSIILEGYTPDQLLSPTGLTASATSNNEIQLAWQDNNTSETGYEIHRATTAAGPFTLIHTTAANGTGYSSAGLTASTTYHYKVRAINGSGTSDFSTPVNATTSGGGGPPAGTPFTLHLNFTQSGYEAPSPWNNLSTPPTQQPTYSGLTDAQGQASPITVQSLTNWSSYGGGTSIGITGMESGIYPANVMKNFFFTDQGSTEQLKFKGLPGGYTYRFTFFASRNSGGDRTTTYKIGTQQVSLNAANNTSNTVTLDGIQPDASGELLLSLITPSSSLFGYLNSIILEAYEPGTLQAPTDLTAQAVSSNSIQLNWTDNNTSETGYEVYRSTSSNSGFTKIATTEANSSTSTSTGLSAGTTYYFKVRAQQNTTFSAYSATVNATTTTGGGSPAGDPFMVQLNFTTSEFLAASPWNNLTAPPTQQPTYSGLNNTQGQATPITLQSLTNWSAFYDNTSQGSGGMASGIYPANVIKTYFFADANSTEQLRFAGLPAGYAYRLTFFGSRDGTGDRTTTYKIGAQQVSLNAAGNTTNTVTLSGVYPDASGELLLEIVTPSSSSFGYLNALVLEGYDPNQLVAPTDLVATAISGSQVVLGWQDTNSSETGYQVERKTGSTGTYQPIQTTTANVTTYTDNGVTEGTPYFYRVRAVNAGGASAYSAPVSVTPAAGGGGGPVLTLYLNFTLAGAEAAAPWNNLSTPPGQKPTYSGLTDEQGQASAITVESLTNWSAYADGTSIGTAGMTSGLYPTNVMKNFFFTDQGSNEQLKFKGLNPALRYRFTLMGSRNGAGDRTTIYKIGSQQASLDASYNTTNTVTLDGLVPAANGELLLEIIAPSSSLFGYLNAVVLQAYDPNAPVGGDPLPVIAALRDTILTVGLPYQQIIQSTTGSAPYVLGDRVVVLGSSTAAGTGPSPGQGWVALLQNHLQTQSSGSQMTNLAVGGYTTRNVLLSGDANHNITKALSLNPSVILVNLPSNDVASGISDQESMDNFTMLKTQADAAGVPIYFTTTQPRNFGTLAERQRLSSQAMQIKNGFSPYVIDIYADLADADYRIKSEYSSGDGIHLNNAGHQMIFTKVRGLFDSPPAPAPGGESGSNISLSVSGLPPFLTFTSDGSGTGTLAGTPAAADVGTYESIVITATNGAASSQRTVRLTVVEELPDLVAQNPSATTVDLSWTDISGETGYEILRKESTSDFTSLSSVAANETSYRDNGAQASTAYTYRVLAKNGVATLTQSEVSITTLAASALVIPAQLLVSGQTADQIELRWLYEGELSEVDFVIERKTEGSSFVVLATLTEGELQYTDLNLSPTTRYAYQVFARLKSDNTQRSDYSNEVTGATHSLATPEPISGTNYQTQYNGNIAAIKWNSQGLHEKQEKLYYFNYDPVNRLTAARYAERAKLTPTWNQAPGHYSAEDISYDANGNIGSLTRFTGQGGRHAIDVLSYTYNAGNQLLSVNDASASDQGFVDGNTSGIDYQYDKNGNLELDKNKYISSISYNLLNLPETIVFEKEDKQATIQYLYDVAGTKLRKLVTDYEGSVTTTDYIGGIQYTQTGEEPRILELIQHEEGRVVPKQDGSGYAYHYDIRDHLGNTRVTFSSETITDSYLATMEPELGNDEEVLFGNVAETRQLDQLTNSTESSIPLPDPSYSARLNATQNRVVGPAKSLPVKKDDKVTLSVDAFYFGTDSEDNVGAAAILPYVIGAFTGQGVVDGQALSEAIQLGGALPAATLLSNNNGGIPYAYLNFMFFDENFVYRPLTTSGNDYVPVTQAAQQNHETLAVELTMPTSGYLYVYISNESNWNINVFFDDLSIEHEHSPVVADESYYPFGLTHQQPLSSPNSAYLWSGKERQTDLGLNWDDFGARMYDPALGRFHTQDRFADKYHPLTPYQYAANNPIRYIDINGDSIDVYDPSGALVTTLDDGKEKVTGMYFQDSKTNKKGKTTYSNGVSFEYNDTELDRAGAKNDGLKVRFADRDINNAMNQSGVNSPKAQDSPWSYIERESRPKGEEALLSDEKSGGKMDYLNYTKYGYLNIVRGPNGDRVAYNDYDHGNFLWGMGGNRLGFSYRTLQGASQLNNAVNSGSDNPGVPYRLLDSNADQRAIRNGYYYGIRSQKADPQK